VNWFIEEAVVKEGKKTEWVSGYRFLIFSPSLIPLAMNLRPKRQKGKRESSL